MRQRFFIIASVLYIALGLIMVFRSATAHAYPVILLGVVFIALGLVRLRDLGRQRSGL